jgi:hypothetical protein
MKLSKKTSMKQPTPQKTILRAGAALGILLAISTNMLGQTDQTDKLEKENQELKSRIDKLEYLAKKEGLMPSGGAAAKDPPVSALSQINLSGFVSASYFYDVANNHDTHPAGYLWNTTLNSFTVNKIKLTLASPAPEKDKWDAAYRVSMIYGSDATTVDPGAFGAGNSTVPIREAFVELNIPIGTGLDIKAGELISLLNYESGDGGAANANFSQGYQWYYTGNPPDAGIQAAYDFNDMFGIKLRLQNGLYNGPVSVGPKTFMGGFYVQPDKKTSLAFLGFAGRQNFAPIWWDIYGGSFIGSRVLTEKYNLTFATEFDWFQFGSSPIAPPGAVDGHFWSIGGWLTSDFTDKLGLALRGEYLSDPTGFGTIFNSPAPGADAAFPGKIYSTGAGQTLSSVTLTLNYKPVPTIKIQPELRWNHSSYAGALNGKRDQFIVGMGASYIF